METPNITLYTYYALRGRKTLSLYFAFATLLVTFRLISGVAFTEQPVVISAALIVSGIIVGYSLWLYRTYSVKQQQFGKENIAVIENFVPKPNDLVTIFRFNIMMRNVQVLASALVFSGAAGAFNTIMVERKHVSAFFDEPITIVALVVVVAAFVYWNVVVRKGEKLNALTNELKL